MDGGESPSREDTPEGPFPAGPLALPRSPRPARLAPLASSNRVFPPALEFGLDAQLPTLLANASHDYRGDMDDLVRIFGPRVRSVLAEEFRRQLSVVGGGEDVYAATVCHADGLAWRTAVNTPAFHAEDAGEQSLSAEDVRYWRWFPDEWSAPKAKGSPQSDDLLADLEAWISNTSRTKSSTWTEVKRGLVDLLVTSVGTSDVRSVFSEVGATPIFFVYEADSDPAPTVMSLETLNPDHPDPSSLEDALTFWRHEA